MRNLALRRDSLALATLPRLAPEEGGGEVAKVADLFSTFRVFDVNVGAARQPSSITLDQLDTVALAADASNLSAFLFWLSIESPEGFNDLREDARAIIPGLSDISFRNVGGPGDGVVVELDEGPLKDTTRLSEASFGSVRALALLAMLYDPDPPLLTCVEELDHGLHPYVFDRIIDRLREASARTQFLIVTHSPALVTRLNSDELIVCERDPVTGEALIPAIEAEDVRELEKATNGVLGLGELWFSGTLGGVPE
jgi:predicted ATPase